MGSDYHLKRTLFVDAYDSFSSNIVCLLQDCLNTEVTVITIDAAVANDLPRLLQYFDAVVLGPGPGSPYSTQDVGIFDLFWKLKAVDTVPVLGICLGFQSLALAFGASIERLDQPQHGQISTIVHKGNSIFKGIGSLHATLYHSLYAKIHDSGLVLDDDNLWVSEQCPMLEPLAWNMDYSGRQGPVLMGIRHKSKPFYGVQFHPESICSDSGCKQILCNWGRESRSWNLKNRHNFLQTISSPIPYLATNTSTPEKGLQMLQTLTRSWRRVVTKTVDLANLTVPEICEIFALFGDAVILDSSSNQKNLGSHSVIGVLSDNYMRLEYVVGDSYVSFVNSGGKISQLPLNQTTIWQWLSEFMKQVQITNGDPNLPFWGGFIGLFSYEAGLEKYGITGHKSGIPDISLALVERSIVVDHLAKKVHIQSIIEQDGWVELAVKRLRTYKKTECCHRSVANESKDLEDYLRNGSITLPSEIEYKENIRRCQEAIRAGDSYELCLTGETSISVPASNDKLMPWKLYKRLRRKNPAPFSAYVSLGDVQILSSSPEQFLRRDRGKKCSLRPMKGTVKKHDDVTRAMAEKILNSPKERAENLMIVDLIRHDLNTVSGNLGKVSVPELMVVEDFETVYQLSSRIEVEFAATTIKDDIPTAVDILHACLPPGSMTGAPKKRSCEILDKLEARPRQAYSGVFGYLDFGGAAQFSVLIRSAFKRKSSANADVWRIGAGGAITTLSTEQGEWDEMITKLDSALSSFCV